MTPAFTHCALHVRDLDASIEFYQRYCGLDIVKEHGEGTGRTVWLASPGAEQSFGLVLLGGGPERTQGKDDMTHTASACPPARTSIRSLSGRGTRGCLHWEPRDNAPPTGYLCAVRDPSGCVIEFSYGQPLGPHAAGA
jgi:lactoylglutathione lyase